jgi:SAM-dependent methyltransferase
MNRFDETLSPVRWKQNVYSKTGFITVNCRSCDKPIKPFFDLDDMPLVNNFLRKEEIGFEKKFKLGIGFCSHCCLVQLVNNVQPKELFSEYRYFSSVSSSLKDYYKRTADYLITRLGLDKDSFVVEIGSNDGIFLKNFKERGISICGVDPAKNIVEIANNQGIKTIPEFFNHSFAEEFVKKYKTYADLAYGANVLAHVPDIIDFIKGVKTVLSPKGSAVFESPYIGGLLEGKFDTVYHEHVFYFSALAIKNLFSKANLELYDAETTPTQGGSLRIFISHPGVFTIDEKVEKFISLELENKLDTIGPYTNIATKACDLKKDLIGLLGNLKRARKKIAAYGAPAKGNVLLNYFGINSNYLDFITDKSEAKQGFYTPGTHLLIHPPEKIYQERPDYVLILSWNIADEVMGQLKDYHDQGGRFIIPIPEVRII